MAAQPAQQSLAGDLSERAARLGIQLMPVHKNFGLQVSGLDLTHPLSDEQQALLLDAWRWHDLLLFRGQDIAPADEQRLLQYFPHDAQVSFPTSTPGRNF